MRQETPIAVNFRLILQYWLYSFPIEPNWSTLVELEMIFLSGIIEFSSFVEKGFGTRSSALYLKISRKAYEFGGKFSTLMSLTKLKYWII